MKTITYVARDVHVDALKAEVLNHFLPPFRRRPVETRAAILLITPTHQQHTHIYHIKQQTRDNLCALAENEWWVAYLVDGVDVNRMRTFFQEVRHDIQVTVDRS